MKLYYSGLITAIIIITSGYSTNAQVDNWLKIIEQTKVAVKYFSPVKSASFTIVKGKDAKENELGLIKEFSDKYIDVKLTFTKYGSHIEMSGEASSLDKEDLCFTLKIIFPLGELEKNVSWSYDIDSTVSVGADKKLFSNYIDVSTVVPSDGAFDTDENE